MTTDGDSMNIVKIIAILLLVSVQAHAFERVDVKRIPGRSKYRVENYLGKSRDCRIIKQGEVCKYRNEEIEITYVDGKPNWIKVNNLHTYQFNKDVLSAVGLKPVKPDIKIIFLMKWYNIQGFREVVAHRTGSSVDYMYFKIK